MAFDDVLEANAKYAANFSYRSVPGTAATGLLVLTCMDCRINPYEVLGLQVGEAKILRTPGGFLNPSVLAGIVVAVHKLQVKRIMVLEHTHCTMASATEDEIRSYIETHSGKSAGDLVFGADPNQDAHLRRDVETLRHHPLIEGFAEVGGFSYDLDTGTVSAVC